MLCVLVLFSLRETRLNNITHQKSPLSPWSPLHRRVQPIFTWVLQLVNYAMLSPDFSSRPSSPELPAPVLSSASTPCSLLPVKRLRTTWVWNHMPDQDPQTQYFNKIQANRSGAVDTVRVATRRLVVPEL